MDRKNIRKILWGKGNESTDSIPETVWTFWNSDRRTPLIDVCLQQVRSLLPDYEINILSFENLRNFLPNIPEYRKELPLANYSDLIRLSLLKEYGGIWMDASILLTQNLDWIYKIKEKDKSDVVGFYSDFFTSDWDFPLLESWFIATTVNNKFISNWADEFERCYTSEDPYSYFNREKENPLFLQKLDEYLSKYLIVYLAASKVMREKQDYRISMISANQEGHYYNFGLQLKAHQLQELFLFKEKEISDIPKIIKFERKGREAIDEALARGQYSRKSLLFKISPPLCLYDYYLNKMPKLWKYYNYIIKNIIKKYAK